MTSDDFWGEKADADPAPTESEQPAGVEPTGSGRPGWPLADPNGPAPAGQGGWPQPTPPPPGGQPAWPQGGGAPQGGPGSPYGEGPQAGQGSQYGPGQGPGYAQYGQPGQPQPGQPPYGQGPQYGQPQYGATQPGQLPQYADYAQPGQGQYGQNQYGQNQYGQGQYGQGQYPQAGQYPQQAGPYGMQAAQMAGYGRRNPFAIAALVCGCVQILLFWTLILWPVLAIGAIACGLAALRQIHQRHDRGRGMAISGIVLGSVGMLFFLAVIGLVVGHVHNG
jgi:Domain of unknown function (DUF4190)